MAKMHLFSILDVLLPDYLEAKEEDIYLSNVII